MARVYFSLGSNLGNRIAHLEYGVRALEASVGPVRRRSSTYVTAPHCAPPQDDFLNLVLECETSLSPEDTLARTQAIEVERGRVREGSSGPRTLDIDILLYDNQTIDTPDLQIPHPRIEQRAFVLVPLAEIAPDLVLSCGRSVAERMADPEIASQRVLKVNDADL